MNWPHLMRRVSRADWPILIAAYYGHTDSMLRLYRQRRRETNRKRWPLHSRFIEIPVVNGHEIAAIVAHKNGAPWPPAVTATAAMNGQTECMIRLVEEGAPWSPKTTQYAARNGHTYTMLTAVARGCPWAESVTRVAAANGYTETMLAAVEHGCPWSFLTIPLAAGNGQTETVLAALNNGAPTGLGALQRAARGGHFETFTALIQDGRIQDPWVLSANCSFGTVIIYMRLSDIGAILWNHQNSPSTFTGPKMRSALRIALFVRWWMSCTAHGRLRDLAFTGVAHQMHIRQPRTIVRDIARSDQISWSTRRRLGFLRTCVKTPVVR